MKFKTQVMGFLRGMSFTKEKTKPFEKMDPCEKRIAIAKDVIQQLNMKKFESKPGTYIHLTSLNYNKDASEEMQKEEAGCKVCAKGAIFMSHVMKTGGGCSVVEADHSGSDEIIRRMDGIFTKDQLDMMESAFECKRFGGSLMWESIHFGRQYPNSEDRLRAIMSNVILNGGEFKP